MPPDLASIRADALGFLHVRVAEAYNHESMAYIREHLNRSGGRVMEELNTQFVPKISTFDRITIVTLPSADPSDGIVVIAKFTEAVDFKAIQKAYLPGSTLVKNTKVPTLVNQDKTFALMMPEPSTMVFGSAKELLKATKPMAGPHPLAKEIAECAKGKQAIYLTANLSNLPIPAEALEQVPEKIQPLIAARSTTLTMELGKQTTFVWKLTYADEAAAKKAEGAIRQGCDMGRQLIAQQRKEPERVIFERKPKEGHRKADELPEFVAAMASIAGMNMLDDLLAKPPITREGTDMTIRFEAPSWMTNYLAMTAMSAGVALPAVYRVREAAARAQSSNNLKQIGIALHGYHDTNGTLPTAAIVDKKGKPLLSWRVAILPFIEQDNLYRAFKLNEPWDSEHNIKLSQIAIKTYMDPRMPQTPANMTYYKGFRGKRAVFTNLRGTKLQEIPDGTSNTIMVVAAGEPVVWSKPDDFEFDADKDPPDISKPFEQVLALFGDGSIRLLDMAKVKKGDTLKRLIMTDDGKEAPDF
ncbi:MAG: DUF1559 domain-containing protein [Fimbriiglobus sp.]